jgi:hypothetical protein
MHPTLFAAVIAASAVASTAEPADPSAVKLALAHRYAQAIHMENVLGSTMNNLMPIVIDRAAHAKGIAVTSELKDAMARAAERSARNITPRMLDIMTPVIAETFTEDELKAAVAFYESRQAQSLLAKTPAFTARVMPKLAELMPAIEADLQAQVCQEIGCDPKK